VSDRLIRVAVGLEDSADLIDDINKFDAAKITAEAKAYK